MQKILYNVSHIMSNAFFICIIIAFIYSIRKAFYKGQKSRIKLYLMTFLTNPLIVFFLSFVPTVFIAWLVCVISSGNVNGAFDYIDNSDVYNMWIVLAGGFMYVILTILFAYLMGKWLKVYNRSLLIFLYLMFATIYGLSGSININHYDGHYVLLTSVNTLNYFALTVSVILLYLLVIRSLARLTDKERRINWKVFLIPTSLFYPLFFTLDYLTYELGGYAANVVSKIFSIIILYLFIWAFFVIINNIRATDDALNAKDEIKTLSVEVMEALAHTIDAKDEYTRGHSVRVAKYSRMLAEKMGLTPEDCENVYYMGLLHDIGKIGVPNEIINSKNKLSDAEYSVIKTHPGIGYDILAEIKSRPDLCIGARWHHERYDGKGYPDGKAGEEIPLYARIIAVADSYDAMTSNRSYRKYLPQDVVRSEIEKNEGTQFDPEVAKYMLMMIDEDKDYTLREN